MKIRILLILVVSFIMLFSCKKDKENLRNSEMSLSANYSGLWRLNLIQNELSIRGKIAPSIAPQNQIEVKISSNADPIGFIISANLSDSEISEDNVTFLYKDLNEIVTAGNFSDKRRKIIKVNPEGDEIQVMVGNNLMKGQYPIDCSDVLHLTYWPYDHTATLFLDGYRFLGTEHKEIYAWTSRDPYPILIQLEYDNPLQYSILPNFNNYNASIAFIDNYSSMPNFLGVFFQHDIVFIEYNGTVYSSALGINTFAPLVPTQYKSRIK